MQIKSREPRQTCLGGLEELLSPGFFKALGDPNRLLILVHLATARGPFTVKEIADLLPIDVSVVSRHLALLRDAGWLEAERQGRQVYYHVPYDRLVDTLRRMADALEACCGSASGTRAEQSSCSTSCNTDPDATT